MVKNMRSHLYRSRATVVVLGLIAIFAFSGCAHNNADVSLNDSNFKPKGSSIAIISGTKEADNVVLAKMIGDSLRKHSRYHVASSAQISKAMGTYPQNIKGPYKSAYFYIDTDWDLGDRKKIESIQRSLGVDYLYVIWAPIAVSSNGSNMARMPAVAQLFEQPNAREVAKSSMDLVVGDKGNVFLKEGVEEIARQLAEETKMAKVAKGK